MDFANHITIDTEKCIGCGLCKRACPALLLDVDTDTKKAFSHPVEKLSWYGCWKCQHCLAVCPQGAISVLGKKPEDSLPAPDFEIDLGDAVDRLVSVRRSCRHFKQENVDPKLVSHILSIAQTAPTGGNKMLVEYTLIDDIQTMNKLRAMMEEGYKKLWADGQYPPTWDDESMTIMKNREAQAMNGDMFFCSAPHYLVPHMASRSNSALVDCAIHLSYLELLCNAHGLGTVILGFPMNILNMMPEIKALLQIPEDHIICNGLGFGYPEFSYARSVQKSDPGKIHRITIE